MSRALRLLAATHLVLTSGDHLLELEPALRPLLTCTCTPQRTILACRRYAGKVWLLELAASRLAAAGSARLRDGYRRRAALGEREEQRRAWR